VRNNLGVRGRLFERGEEIARQAQGQNPAWEAWDTSFSRVTGAKARQVRGIRFEGRGIPRQPCAQPRSSARTSPRPRPSLLLTDAAGQSRSARPDRG
jgi:hypothetical protein